MHRSMLCTKELGKVEISAMRNLNFGGLAHNIIICPFLLKTHSATKSITPWLYLFSCNIITSSQRLYLTKIIHLLKIQLKVFFIVLMVIFWMLIKHGMLKAETRYFECFLEMSLHWSEMFAWRMCIDHIQLYFLIHVLWKVNRGVFYPTHLVCICSGQSVE